MRADEALKESKDGYIWLGDKGAFTSSITGSLYWCWSFGIVTLEDIMSNNWQPSKPVELCGACDAAGRLDENFGVGTLQADHLRSFHCVCKKKGEV